MVSGRFSSEPAVVVSGIGSLDFALGAYFSFEQWSSLGFQRLDSGTIQFVHKRSWILADGHVAEALECVGLVESAELVFDSLFYCQSSLRRFPGMRLGKQELS